MSLDYVTDLDFYNPLISGRNLVRLLSGSFYQPRLEPFPLEWKRQYNLQ